jgi:hypothetical protein
VGSEQLASLAPLIRSGRDSDIAFIHSSWKKSLREYSPTLGNDAYYRLANAVCSAVLAADPIVLIAYGEGAPSVIRGWLCAEATPSAIVLWMAYCKAWARRQGVFHALLSAAEALAREEGAGPGRVFTFHTRMDAHIERRGWTRLSVAKALHLRA